MRNDGWLLRWLLSNFHARSGLQFALVGLLAGFAAPGYCADPSNAGVTTNPAWVVTGSLNIGRAGHTATLLANGKVLVVGGDGGDGSSGSAELYDPSTGAWSLTGSLNHRRTNHSATLLPDGRVLVAGGDFSDTAELYDPGTGTWTFTGKMRVRRGFHLATLLRTGKVLVVAGGNGQGFIRDCELYDPATGTWSSTGSMGGYGRAEAQATLLQDGRVLLTGGTYDADEVYGVQTAEVYDPASGTWQPTADLSVPRFNHSATLLPNGKVLVAGGDRTPCPRDPCTATAAGRGPPTPPNNTAELFDPGTGRWGLTGSLSTGRSGHTASLLPNGDVLVAGGYTFAPPGPGGLTKSAERYDASGALWRNTSDLGTTRYGHTATLLPNGAVLVAGGSDEAGGRRAELYDPNGLLAGSIGAGHTGSWFNPAQNGHGFMLEVLPGARMQLLASWFAFAPEGGPVWIVGVGPIDGNKAAVDGFQSVGSGGRFPPNFDAANVHQESWGTLIFKFSDCNHGHVDWAATAPGYGSGGMDLMRLTLPAGLNCSN